jgi:endonuclease VIII-like 1
MPELAEIKIMSEYINDVCENEDFTSIAFSPNACKRGMSIVQDSDLQIFKIKAESRGKELMLSIIQGPEVFMKISCAMGMTGNWIFCDRNIDIKHGQMKFNSVSGKSLVLVDMRHFARWKVAEDWSNKRGPCPLSEHDSFREHVMTGLEKSKKTFEKPIMELLMDQKWFNGIGNYLRAEILDRHKDEINPFDPAHEVITKNPLLFNTILDVVFESYVMGGGELKDWDNPYTRGYGRGRINEKMKIDAPFTFREWLSCYQKKESIIDSKNRRFWYDKMYTDSADIYYKNISCKKSGRNL